MRYENSFNVFFHYLQYCIYKHYVLKKFTLTWNTKLYKYLICITQFRQRFLHKDHLIGLEQHSKFLTKIFDHLSTLNFCLGLVWNSRTSFPPNYLIISIMFFLLNQQNKFPAKIFDYHPPDFNLGFGLNHHTNFLLSLATLIQSNITVFFITKFST